MSASSNVVPFTGPATFAAPAWPDANDAPDLLAIVQAQTETVADNAVLIDRYQSILNTAQARPQQVVATGIGTASGNPMTTLTLTSVSGSIAIGATVVGSGIPAGTVVLQQTSGPAGGAGVYLTSQATTANAAPLAFIPPATPPAVATATGASTTSTSLTVTAVTGTILVGSTVSGLGVPAQTIILNQQSGTTGGAGVYTTSQITNVATQPVAFMPPPAPDEVLAWPPVTDAPTLTLVMADQTAIIRTQSALIQHYQQLLNDSQTPAA